VSLGDCGGQKLFSASLPGEIEAAAMNTPATGAPLLDPTMERLEDQISWYDRKSLLNQRYFKRIKIIEISAPALIPFVSALQFQPLAWVSGGPGIVITVLRRCYISTSMSRIGLRIDRPASLSSTKNMCIWGRPDLIRAPQMRTLCWLTELSRWFPKNTPNGLPCSSNSQNRAPDNRAIDLTLVAGVAQLGVGEVRL
jgi:hypothetical protein